MDRRLGLLLLGLCAVAALLLRLLIDFDPNTQTLSLAWPQSQWRDLRVDAMLAGAALGGALALSGTMLQAALRKRVRPIRVVHPVEVLDLSYRDVAGASPFEG